MKGCWEKKEEKRKNEENVTYSEARGQERIPSRPRLQELCKCGLFLTTGDRKSLFIASLGVYIKQEHNFSQYLRGIFSKSYYKIK
jgi:hypothetical protein